MLEYVYGKNVVLQLIKNEKPILQLYVTENLYNQQFRELVKVNKINYQIVGKKKLEQLAKTENHQGVVAEIEGYKSYQLSEIISNSNNGLIVMLDGLTDPHNLGAILRTCDAVKAEGVIIGKHRSVSLNSTVAKVSTGAIDTVKVAIVTNLVNSIKELKEKGYWVVGCDMGGDSYFAPKYDMPICLVIGSEGFGISQLVKKNCDFFVSIPMLGSITSLNASVATALVMYQIQHNRSLL